MGGTLVLFTSNVSMVDKIYLPNGGKDHLYILVQFDIFQANVDINVHKTYLLFELDCPLFLN